MSTSPVVPGGRRRVSGVLWSLAVVALVAVLSLAAAAPVEAGEGEKVPADMTHFTLDGKKLILSDYVEVPGSKFKPVPKLHGPVVLVFGAHWCLPCKEVMAALARSREALGAANASILYVHVDDRDRSDGLDKDEIRQRATEMARGADYQGVTVMLGGDLKEVAAWFAPDNPDAIVALPAVIFVSKDGAILGRSGTDGFEQALASFLDTIKAQ